MKIVSRKEALEKGLTRYYTGVPCKRGHLSERYVSSKLCIACRSGDRKCSRCNIYKKAHLFNISNSWCKSCTKKDKIIKRKSLKTDDFWKWKAKTLRNGWNTRAKKLGIDVSELPSITEIINWLNTIELKCYYTNVELTKDNIEFDHLIPISRGGSLKLNNIKPTLPQINRAKGDMTEIEFKELLACISKWEDSGDRILQRLRASHFGKRK